jgi:hypothetical protein
MAAGVVPLELFPYLVQGAVVFRHSLFQAGKVLVGVSLGPAVESVRGPQTGNHILALGVDQPLAVEMVVACGRVPGESHTCCTIVSHVAENHSLDVDRGTPLVRDPFDASVSDGSLSVPGKENGPDASPELIPGVVGKLHAEDLLDLRFVLFAKLLELLRCKIVVVEVLFPLFQRLQHMLKLLADPFALFRLDPGGFLHDHVAVHGDEPAVSVINEPFIAGPGHHPGYGPGGESDIEHGLHHAGHAGSGAGTNREEKRVIDITELRAHLGLDLPDGLVRLVLESFGVLPFQAVEFIAYLG